MKQRQETLASFQLEDMGFTRPSSWSAVADGESDFRIWTMNDYVCYIRRHPALGHWCGYVVIPEDHPMANGSRDEELDVHGGVTFHSSPEDGYVTLGFDAGHAGDEIPEQSLMLKGVYRDETYMLIETNRLARQLWIRRQPPFGP